MTQKKAYNFQKKAKVWNQEYFGNMFLQLYFQILENLLFQKNPQIRRKCSKDRIIFGLWCAKSVNLGANISFLV
jgi:hypothetical protein